MDEDTIKKYGTCLCASLVVSVLFLALSWDTVEPTEWGLKYNSLTKSIQNDTSELFFMMEEDILFGRCIHLLHSQESLRPQNFLQGEKLKVFEYLSEIFTCNCYKKKAQPLRTRTAEGLALGLHVSFQYQLIPKEIPALYAMNNIEYEATFIRIARDTILQAAGNYEAPRYWVQAQQQQIEDIMLAQEDRSKIAKEMLKELDEELTKAHSRCVYLQLLQIELPGTYENSIVETQVEVQNSKMKKYEQEAALIRQGINIMRSQTSQDVQIINATAQAEAYQLRKKAEAQAQENTIGAERDVYSQIKQDLSLDPKDLDQFIFYNGLLGKNSDILVGFQNMMYTHNPNNK